MKNRTFFILLLLGSTINIFAQKDSTLLKETKPAEKQRMFNFSFTWFEAGASIPLQENRLQNLPYGMSSYLAGPEVGSSFGFWGLGLYYKNHWGFSTIFTLQDYHVPDAAFRNYITSQYPGYFLSNAVQGHIYAVNNINFRLSYRFQTGKFAFEPQFQMGINDCKDFDNHFVLKEIGSNQFIEYDIKKENKKKNLLSYHLALKTAWCYTKPTANWNVEPGIRLDFMIIPTDFRYTITTTPYNKPETAVTVDVKRMRPAITITAFINFFKK